MPTKVLVAARWLALDRTSEGICSSKFLLALARAGYDVTCLTTDGAVAGKGNGAGAPWLQPVRLIHTSSVGSSGPWSRLAGLSARIAAGGKMGGYGAQKLNAAWAYATGYDSYFWREVESWMHAIRRVTEQESPDVIVTRGAGTDFSAHMAMLKWRPNVPWIANYHDPFPVSLYPPPYRRYIPMISHWQERLHRRIVASADALTFPSQRLLRWVLSGDLERYQRKAFVLSHIAGELPESPAQQVVEIPRRGDLFTIVHTGTVLRERDPRALLRGFAHFVEQDPRRRDQARLVLVGRVNRTHLESEEWKRLEASGNFEYRDTRVSFQAALETARAADALLILEAGAAESPFFPAKLADYLWLRKPILALSPRQSATVDILGLDYPLRISPDDAAAVTRALTLLWDRWSTGHLADLIPDRQIASSMSEDSVQTEFRRILSFTAQIKRDRVA